MRAYTFDKTNGYQAKTVKLDYCDNCGRKQPLTEILLANESGRAFYCDDCIKNNPSVKIAVI